MNMLKKDIRPFSIVRLFEENPRLSLLEKEMAELVTSLNNPNSLQKRLEENVMPELAFRLKSLRQKSKAYQTLLLTLSNLEIGIIIASYE